MAIDAKDYAKLKAEGRVRVGGSEPLGDHIKAIVQVAGNVFLVEKKWNADNGEVLPPYMTQVDLGALKKQRDQLQKNIDGIDAVIADVETVMQET